MVCTSCGYADGFHEPWCPAFGRAPVQEPASLNVGAAVGVAAVAGLLVNAIAREAVGDYGFEGGWFTSLIVRLLLPMAVIVAALVVARRLTKLDRPARDAAIAVAPAIVGSLVIMAVVAPSAGSGIGQRVRLVSAYAGPHFVGIDQFKYGDAVRFVFATMLISALVAGAAAGAVFFDDTRRAMYAAGGAAAASGALALVCAIPPDSVISGQPSIVLRTLWIVAAVVGASLALKLLQGSSPRPFAPTAMYPAAASPPPPPPGAPPPPPPTVAPPPPPTVAPPTPEPVVVASPPPPPTVAPVVVAPPPPPTPEPVVAPPSAPSFEFDDSATILAANVPMLRAARYTLRLDDGRTIEIAGRVILGRDPQRMRRDDAEAELVIVDDAGRTLSRTHLAITATDDGLFVEDRGSVNGSALVSPAGVQTPLPHATPTQVGEGWTILFGACRAPVARI